MSSNDDILHQYFTNQKNKSNAANEKEMADEADQLELKGHLVTCTCFPRCKHNYGHSVENVRSYPSSLYQNHTKVLPRANVRVVFLCSWLNEPSWWNRTNHSAAQSYSSTKVGAYSESTLR